VECNLYNFYELMIKEPKIVVHQNSLLDIAQPGMGWHVPELVLKSLLCECMHALRLFITTHGEKALVNG